MKLKRIGKLNLAHTVGLLGIGFSVRPIRLCKLVKAILECLLSF